MTLYNIDAWQGNFHHTVEGDHKPVLSHQQSPNHRQSPVGDVLHVADGVVRVALLGAEDDGVEVPVDHGGAQALELSHQPDAAQQHNHWLSLHPTNTLAEPTTSRS